MPFFATDFGAVVPVFCCAGVVLLAVVALSLLGIRIGTRLRLRESKPARRAGTALVAACCLLPFATYYGPSIYTRITLGRWPLGRLPNDIEKGMTHEDVLNRLGRPNELYERDGEESWYYYVDSIGADLYGVYFGTDGRVTGTHIPS